MYRKDVLEDDDQDVLDWHQPAGAQVKRSVVVVVVVGRHAR